MPVQKCDKCSRLATHIIIDKDTTPFKKMKLCCEDYMKFIKDESKEYLIRNCSVCGKKLKIRLYDDGHYSGGHYFGKIRLPLKTAKKFRREKLFGIEVKVAKVLKYGKEVEYWECNKCFNSEK